MQRALSKIESRQKVIDAARYRFETETYEQTTIRGIAEHLGRSTGLVFAHSPDKESLWRAAMGTPPPVDGPLTRAAPRMRDLLEAMLARRASGALDSERLWKEIEQVVREAGGEVPAADPTASGTDEGLIMPGLTRFASELVATVETREARPSLTTVMDPVFHLCERLVAYADGKSSETAIREAALDACATLAQVAVQGTAEVPLDRGGRPGRDPGSARADVRARARVRQDR